jgi:hypothetical protein
MLRSQLRATNDSALFPFAQLSLPLPLDFRISSQLSRPRLSRPPGGAMTWICTMDSASYAALGRSVYRIGMPISLVSL